MPSDIQSPRIDSKESPRSILAYDFKSIGEIPIRGGWGYTLEDAVIIDKHDPIVPKGEPFDGVGLEYVFVEKRIYEELIIFRDRADRFSGIAWKLLKQASMRHADRVYDVLTFEVTALPDRIWEQLKTEWEGPTGITSSDFDVEAHKLKRDSLAIRYVAEYYFDITSFFGSSRSHSKA